MDSMMSMMHSHINRTINFAVSEKVVPDIQNTMSSLSSGLRDTESGSSSNNQKNGDVKPGSKLNLQKRTVGLPLS